MWETILLIHTAILVRLSLRLKNSEFDGWTLGVSFFGFVTEH